MELKGWKFDISFDKPSNCGADCDLSKCGDKTWYGYKQPGTGGVWATFSGTGRAKLDFGNCHPQSGKAKAYLVHADVPTLLGTAEKNTPAKQIMFDFSPGDILLIQEVDEGVIKLNSLTINCKGE